jgi:O-antigen ligase
LDVISEQANELNVSSVTRNTDDVKQLAGRYIVWDNAFQFLSEFSSMHIVGYGLFSQTISGLSNEYYSLGKLFQNPERVTLHNSYLQYLLDVGYIGVLVFLLAYYSVLRKLKQLSKYYSSKIHTVGIAFLFFMGLSSLFETSLTLYNVSTAFIVLFMMVITLFFQHREQRAIQ